MENLRFAEWDLRFLYWKKRARAGLARAPPGLCPCFSLENRREDNTNFQPDLHAPAVNSTPFWPTPRSDPDSTPISPTLDPKSANSSRFCSTPRVFGFSPTPRVYFGSTPRVLAQLHVFRTPGFGPQLRAFRPNSTRHRDTSQQASYRGGVR